MVLERGAAFGGAAVSERPFAGIDARLSRYAYLVSLLPASIVRELGLGREVRLARRAVASYTPDPRAPGRGLLVDAEDAAATRASFAATAGSDRERAAFEDFYAMTGRVARALFPTMTQPLRSREEIRSLIGDDRAFEALFERPIGATVDAAFSDDVVAGVVLTDALIGTFAAAHDDDLRQNRCLLYHLIGNGTGDWLVPVGGMGALTAALERAARAAGAPSRRTRRCSPSRPTPPASTSATPTAPPSTSCAPATCSSTPRPPSWRGCWAEPMPSRAPRARSSR